MLSTSLDAETCYPTDSFDTKGTSSEENESGSTEATGSPARYLGTLILSILTEAQVDRYASAGQNLVDYLAELSPGERSELIGSPQVEHYLHRLVQNALINDRHHEIIRKLMDYFPGKIADFQEKKLPVIYSYTDVEPSKSKGVRTSITHSKRAVETGQQMQYEQPNLFEYDPNTLAATFRAPQIKLDDVKRASVAVAMDVREIERAMYGINISPAKRSLSMGWYDKKNMPARLPHPGESRPSKRTPDRKTSTDKTLLVPVLRNELDDPHFKFSKSRNSLFPQKHQESLLVLQTFPVSVNGLPLKSAFDVIEAFASGQLQSESESVYLNYTNPDHSCPYDLSVTLKTKVTPEHFVISNFGIIHVYPDGMSDFQTFAEWLREASMFTLMRQIPFFREYKLKHAFWQWHKAVQSAKLHRLTFKINKTCIRFFPIYADALLKLKHLSEELLTISFHHLKPLGGYTVDAIEHSLQGSQTKAQQFLLKYFKYSKRIVCAAIESSKKHANDLETEHHHQPFVPEIPLSIQKKKHEKLERDLEAATYQKERIGDFVYLAEQLVYNCLMQLARCCAYSWKELVLSPIPKQASSGFQIVMPHRHHHHIPQDKQIIGDNYLMLSSLIIDGSGKSCKLTANSCNCCRGGGP